MHKFDASIEWDCAKAIIKIIRAGKVGEGQVLEASQHAAWFTGCAIELFNESSPDPAPPAPDDDLFGAGATDLTSQCDLLEQSLLDLNAKTQLSGGLFDNIDWDLVFNKIIPFILAMIQQFADQKENG